MRILLELTQLVSEGFVIEDGIITYEGPSCLSTVSPEQIESRREVVFGEDLQEPAYHTEVILSFGEVVLIDNTVEEFDEIMESMGYSFPEEPEEIEEFPKEVVYPEMMAA